jgi:hypothetical protein
MVQTGARKQTFIYLNQRSNNAIMHILLVTIMQDSSVCSISKKDKTIITDLDSGEMVCSKCGVVISDNNLLGLSTSCNT